MLFILDSDVDKYGGFFWEDKSQHMALISSDPLGPAWKPPAIHSSRLPKKILKLGPPDFGEVSPGNYLMQPKVYEALKPLWADAGEAFEAETTRGPYLLFHVTNEIDGLDCDRSEMTFFDEEKTRVMMINRYKFRDDVIQGNHLFRIPQSYKLESFVTQEVKDIVEAEGFTGFYFTKIRWAE